MKPLPAEPKAAPISPLQRALKKNLDLRARFNALRDELVAVECRIVKLRDF